MTYGKPTDPLPTLFIPHGGGPCFFMDWHMGPPDTWQKMELWLRQLGGSIGSTPEAVIVISGHWEEPRVTINSATNPPLYFDYYGFPPHTYELEYPAKGDPALVVEMTNLLSTAGIDCAHETERGLDHGVFIPFLLIYPEANIPIVQLSLKADLDPATHLQIGKALQPLRSRGVLLVGSGMSFHNAGIARHGAKSIPEAKEFDDWLSAACTGPVENRDALLCQWSQAPSGRFAHPREEHLLPLMVVAGAAGKDQGQKIYADEVMNMTVSGYQFG